MKGSERLWFGVSCLAIIGLVRFGALLISTDNPGSIVVVILIYFLGVFWLYMSKESHIANAPDLKYPWRWLSIFYLMHRAYTGINKIADRYLTTEEEK